MKLLKATWIISLLFIILMFFDQITGIETEDAGGMVTAVSGNITGKYCWPILFTSAIVFLMTTLSLLVLLVINKSKRSKA